MQWLILLLSLIAADLFGSFRHQLKEVDSKSSRHSMRNIDFIYMINLDERPEKLEKSLSQLRPFGIDPYRFSAVNGWQLSLEAINDVGLKFAPWMEKGIWATYYTEENGEVVAQHELAYDTEKSYFVHRMGKGTIGIALSHLSILVDAYQSGYETIWVMEDDIEVSKNPKLLSSLIDKLDKLVGKGNWDILFTDIDYKNAEGKYIPCTGYAPRPNFKPADPSVFAKRVDISRDFTQIGARFGAHSMIIRRSGIEKLLAFFDEYSIFLPYDMDFVLPPTIRLYCLRYDIVGQLSGAISDNGSPPPEKK